jgi:hypothetical protein
MHMYVCMHVYTHTNDDDTDDDDDNHDDDFFFVLAETKNGLLLIIILYWLACASLLCKAPNDHPDVPNNIISHVL